MSMQLTLTPQLLLEAYAQGLFPMAYSADSEQVHWVCPEQRGQLDILDLHVPKSLQKTIHKNTKQNVSYIIKINTAFDDVMRECAKESEGRTETWINDQIIDAYCGLHDLGHAHSVEYWSDGKLMGGLYGVSIGGAFFGESMFSRVSDASKVALVHLCARLWKAGYSVLDTQFINDHLLQFGAYEIPHKTYMAQLQDVLGQTTNFTLAGLDEYELISAYFAERAAVSNS